MQANNIEEIEKGTRDLEYKNGEYRIKSKEPKSRIAREIYNREKQCKKSE
jgi:hypothetical protein